MIKKTITLELFDLQTKNSELPLKETCYRFLAIDLFRQSYFVDVPFKDNKCKYYWNIK